MWNNSIWKLDEKNLDSIKTCRKGRNMATMREEKSTFQLWPATTGRNHKGINLFPEEQGIWAPHWAPPTPRSCSGKMSPLKHLPLKTNRTYDQENYRTAENRNPVLKGLMHRFTDHPNQCKSIRLRSVQTINEGDPHINFEVSAGGAGTWLWWPGRTALLSPTGHLLIRPFLRDEERELIQLRACVLVTHSCSTLCDPVDCSPPGSSVHGILQARIPEWVAMPSSRGSSQPRDWTYVSHVSCIGRRALYRQCHLGSPKC